MKVSQRGLLRGFLLTLGFFTRFFLAAAMIGPAISSTGFNMGRAQEEGGPIISAIEKSRHDHGVLPISLAKLVPQYLPEWKDVLWGFGSNSHHPLKRT